MLSRLRLLHPKTAAFSPRDAPYKSFGHDDEHPGVETSAYFDVQMAEHELDCDNGYEAKSSPEPMSIGSKSSCPLKASPFVYKGFGSVTYNAYDVDQEMSAIMSRVSLTYPAACSESVYQKAVLREAYLAGLPVMVERDVFSDYGNGSLLMGRVDMEVAGVCLYELKIGKPNIDVHALQLKKYLRAYDHNKENIMVAKLVYFTSNRLITHVLRDAKPVIV
jgi:hypothetical protein